MLVLTNIGKQISKPKKGEFLYIFFGRRDKTSSHQAENPAQWASMIFIGPQVTSLRMPIARLVSKRH